jgi:hypothetical protein
VTQQLWPYPAQSPATEVLEWASDVIQAKGAEQRIALRVAPRRTFNYSHIMRTEQATGAIWRYRDAQGDGGFLIPDWAQCVMVRDLDSSADVEIPNDIGLFDFGTQALVYKDIDSYELVNIERESVGATLETLSTNYDSALLVPVWPAHSQSGLGIQDLGNNLVQLQAEFTTDENVDYSASDYDLYRGEDVLPVCPKLGGGLQSNVVWPNQTVDNVQGVPEFFRQRNIPESTYTMRWQVFTREERWSLRRWLHSRRGRQKSFWRSSFTSDFTLLQNISGTQVKVSWPSGAVGVTRTVPFDIEIVSGVPSYHRVLEIGEDSNGNLLLTLETPANITQASVSRISVLKHSRFTADRIELEHTAKSGTNAQMPCLEVEEEPDEVDSVLSST